MRFLYYLLISFFIFEWSTAYAVCTSQPGKGASGELGQRMKMVSDRILYGDIPKMSPDFILADISLKPEFKRRFTEFSGDISGRYFDLFASYPIENNPIDIHKLMDEALTFQLPDGRFGNPKLAFDADHLDGQQMALLWGNGRLLVGMMKYYHRYHKSDVLQSARRLGDFLNSIAGNCINPQIVERLKEKNANGYICFTQLMEGLVLLFDETKDSKYMETASRVYTLLPPMGKQHSHGYLNTLLGTLMLYERTGNKEQLQFVTSRYRDLIQSDEYLIFGGVSEYFGNTEAKTGRDEGCSEADFIMLSLRLWQTTGETGYLEKAERCLINHLFANQHQTGDFGHKDFDPEMGFIVSKSVARSWWCCNFHGLRALNEVADNVLTRKDNCLYVNLFFDRNYTDSDFQLSMKQKEGQSNQFTLTVLKTGNNNRLAIRKPSWAKTVALTNGKKSVQLTEKDGYLYVNQPLKPGETFDLNLEYDMRWCGQSNETLTLPLVSKSKVALFYGPYLMSVDTGFQPFFDSEPNWSNRLIVNNNPKFVPELAPVVSNKKNTYILMQHSHSDMFGTYPVVLRPIAETTFELPCNVRVWFLVQ